MFPGRKKWREDLINDNLGEHKTGSNAASQARKIKYRYVPAIKDKTYVADLYQDLYRVLNTKVKHEIGEASKNFTDSVKNRTEELLSSLKEIGLEGQFNPPSDFFCFLQVVGTRHNIEVWRERVQCKLKP